MKYYYDCPVKAAFMAKYHKIRFVETYVLDCYFSADGWEDHGSCEGRFYIHEDSYFVVDTVSTDSLINGRIIMRNGNEFIYPCVDK